MTNVNIRPMPRVLLKYSMKFRPTVAPVFSDIGPEGPTPEDRALARELFLALDEESKEWYRYNCPRLFGDL